MDLASQFARHVQDLATDSFEGHAGRRERFVHFREAVGIATPAVFEVLEDMNSAVLRGTGTVERDQLPDEEEAIYACRWTLSWPLQQHATHRITGGQLEPVVVAVAFPPDYTHPHLGEDKPAVSTSIWAWPFQVASVEDAEQLRPVFEVIAAASLHERIFQAGNGWRVIPAASA